ncbi:type VI secretion system tube protein TssD [Pseudomonas sp. V88_4]|uniref:type VI secretion system tube protein TssD n=1 Tax=Pseudomonas sp. V88_4 TaxID=3044229 RepID=UPI00249E5C8E|nr:type VI secretion system tube protein TssD [Pseudomonas sp. V88_4]MDI3401357.1 type VI secretion system tube protein TssD [Pseudomonas sp. V88_4]
MANPAYMTITGKTRGLISAGCSTPESVGNKYQTAHTDEIMVFALSHEMRRDANLGKPVLQNDAQPQEQLAIRYRGISWVHHIAGTTGYTSWGEAG